MPERLYLLGVFINLKIEIKNGEKKELSNFKCSKLYC